MMQQMIDSLTKEPDASTTVFDTTVTTAGEYRAHFERTAGESWHAQLLAG